LQQRVADSKADNYATNVAILGALSLDRLVAAMTVTGSVDDLVFYTYVIQLPEHSNVQWWNRTFIEDISI